MIAAAGLMASCGPDAERVGAENTLNAAKEYLQKGDFAAAMEQLDTLNSRYGTQIDLRKEGMLLRAEVMQGIAQDSIAVISRELAEATLKRQELEGKFRHIGSSVGLEGYFIPNGAPENVMTETGIQPRVSEKGYLYLVANVQGRAIGLRAIEFKDGAETISSSSISPSRIVSVEGSESASFNPEELEGVGEWLSYHPGASTIILRGSKKDITLKLSDKLRSQICLCYEYAQALQAQRRASVRREKFERMLATARDQMANLPRPEAADK